MSKPTYIQIKEFWERCGWHYTPNYKKKSLLGWGWQPPNITEGYYQDYLPPTDLNNLFEYAVSKLVKEYIELEIHFDYLVESNSWNVALLDGFYNPDEPKHLIAVANSKDPALALFWALRQVKEKSNE